MGLLSYIDEYKAFEKLDEEMLRINEGKRTLYLWKDEATDNIIGLVGFDINAQEDTIVIRYISLNPSFRQEGISYDMLTAVREEFPTYTITGAINMAPFLNKWARKRNDTMEMEALRDSNFENDSTR